MSATVAASTSSGEAKAKIDRAEINRRNSRKSTGPKTAAGKARSRYNAIKHGLTAESVLLPGEDAEEYVALEQMMIGRFKPRTDAELTLVERITGNIWFSNWAEQAAGKRIAERLRHEPLDQIQKEEAEAAELGERLLWQPAFPLPFSKRLQVGELTEPPCSNKAIHPQYPNRLRLQLERTVPGCEWLHERWDDMRGRLEDRGPWLSSDAFHMVRLMGKHAINMADNLEVAGVFLATLALLAASNGRPEQESIDWKHAMIRMLLTFDTAHDYGDEAAMAKYCEPFARRLGELPLAMLAPRDVEQARLWLTSLIEREMERLGEIRAILQEIADADMAEAPGRLAFETGPEGDRHRRYVLSNERLLNRRFSLFLDTRKMSEAGKFDPTSVERKPRSGDAFDYADYSGIDRGEPTHGCELDGPPGAPGTVQPQMPDEPLTTFAPSWEGEPSGEPSARAALREPCLPRITQGNLAIDTPNEPACADTADSVITQPPATGTELPGEMPAQEVCPQRPERRGDEPADAEGPSREAMRDPASILRNEANPPPLESCPAVESAITTANVVMPILSALGGRRLSIEEIMAGRNRLSDVRRPSFVKVKPPPPRRQGASSRRPSRSPPGG